MIRYSGITEKHKTVSRALAVIVVIIGVVLAITAFTAKGSSGSMFTPAKDFPDELRTLLLIAGVFVTLEGVSSFYSSKVIDQSYIEIGSNRVVGSQCSCVICFKKEERFDLTFDQIRDVQIPNPSALTPTLSIMTANKEYKVMIADAEKAAQQIRARIGR